MKIRVTHKSPVHEEILMAILRRHFGFPDKTIDIDQFGVSRNINELACERFGGMPKHILYPLLHRRDRKLGYYFVIIDQSELHTRIDQCDTIVLSLNISHFTGHCTISCAMTSEPAISRRVPISSSGRRVVTST